jgi:hypothetical protein
MRRLLPPILEALFAGLFLCTISASQAVAQTDPTRSASASGQNAEAPSETSPVPPQPAAKKVWTNDDLNGLREDSKISTFTQPNAKPLKSGAKPGTPRSKDAKWYQDRIANLEAQLPPIDEQIGQLQAALSGQTVNSVRKWGGTRPDDWRVELDGLEKKRDGIQARIESLEDQARHDDVRSGALP